MPKEFIMRGKTASGQTEVLNMSGFRPGYGYQLTEFKLWPSSVLGGVAYELNGVITANNTVLAPTTFDFNDDGVIGTAMMQDNDNIHYPISESSIVNDLFVITQDLLLMVEDGSGTSEDINWHARFKEVKLSAPAEAVANFKQYTIYNTSS